MLVTEYTQLFEQNFQSLLNRIIIMYYVLLLLFAIFGSVFGTSVFANHFTVSVCGV